MKQTKVVYWKDGEHFLGYLSDYPEYLSQAYSLDELVENLKDIYNDIENELVPGKRQELILEF